MEVSAGGEARSGSDVVTEIRSSIEHIDHVDRHSDGYLTALAFILHRVAAADQHLSRVEIRQMESILVECASLTPAEAVLTVEMAKHQCRMADCGRAYDASRHLRALLTPTERLSVRSFLDAVAAADGRVQPSEQQEVDQIALELGLTARTLRS
jgi:uncharacterized tellurite resistance protein B-like protein